MASKVACTSQAVVVKDQEVMAAAPKQATMEEPVHMAGILGITSESGHASAPKSGEFLYSKLFCYSCSIGEILGEVICGEHQMCFCIERQEDCGLGGKGGCLKCLNSCELFWPEPRCGCFTKCFCIKCGQFLPLEFPCIVCVGKDII